MGESLIILEKYEVIRRLAIGGMGEIFLARQTGAKGFSRLVILKTLRPELTEQPDALDQFLDEARVAAMLSHPNIVAVYEVGVFRGVHFIAMEYIGGIDLAALLRACMQQKKKLPFRVAAAIIRDAAMGLDHAHHARDENGRHLRVVHRDVSPQNLMIRSDGLVKVVDFGVAVASNQMHETQGDKLKGKIRYMSPEQLLGEDLDNRSDMFSLGIVLWELTTGKPLFLGSNPIDVFQKILSGEMAPPSSAVPEVPPALDEVVMRMLKQRRDDRFARLADVATALRAWLESGGGNVETELQAFIHDVAGAQIADRVRDLTPRQVSIHGIGEGSGPPAPGSTDAGFANAVDTGAPTAVVSTRGKNVAQEVETKVAPKGMFATGESSSIHADAGETGEHEPSVEHSDAGVLLDAAEHSGVLHGDRRFVTVLVGLLPGWSALAQQIANVPMGAFGVNRLKNLFFRQLQVMAEQKKGTIIRKGPDSFVVAFGLTEPEPADAGRALTCAFATQQILDDLAKDPRQRLTAHMGIAGGVALATSADEGPVQLAGSVTDKAERLATLARTMSKGVLVSAQIGELAKTVAGSVEVKPDLVSIDDKQGGDAVFEATGVSARPPATKAVRKKILIADDAEVFRRIEEEILRPFSYSFVHAKNGAEAVKLAVDETPDLILLDIQMPIMDGVQVLSFLKRTESTRDIPVVVVTTIGRSHDEDLMRRGGANAFLTKPVKPGDLIQTVRRLLDDAAPS